MYILDSIINDMKNSCCFNCFSGSATYDETGENVEISGSFCNHDQILIIARSKKTGLEIWSKECDSGRTCTIPFSIQELFECSNIPKI